MRRLPIVLLLLSLAAISTILFAQEDPDMPLVAPDKDATRQQIDALIKDFHDRKKKATIGLIQRATDLAVSFGAPVWNQGSHDKCCAFYVKTAESLVAAFPDETTATPLAYAALTDLKTALTRVQQSKDVDKSAWSMRFAFDKTSLTVTLESDRAASMVEMGQQYMKRLQFDEAADAFKTAVGVLKEMDGTPTDKMPVGCMLAPLALSDALFAQKKFPETTAAILSGLEFFPDWPGMKLDLRTVYTDPDLYDANLDDLKDQAKAAPKDADLQFLLGYEYYFTGRTGAAQVQFEKTLAIDPKHLGARRFMKHIQDENNPPLKTSPESKTSA